MKIAVLYHSVTGSTKKLAELIGKGISSGGDVECRLMSIGDVDLEYLSASQVVVVGCPSYAEGIPLEMLAWLESDHKAYLVGKLGAAFATENYVGGGAEYVLFGLVRSMLCNGMLVYSAGSAQGYPHTHIGVVSVREGDDFQQQRAVIFGERIVKKAKELFSKND